MFSELLKKIGYHGIEDAVEFLMCGIAIVPALLMLSGFMLGGAISMVVLLLLTMLVGMQAPPLPPRAEKKDNRPDNFPRR